MNYWIDKLRRMVRGRQRWRAEDEYDYYRVSPQAVREHAERQVEAEGEAFFPGMQVARSLGILNATSLHGARVLEIGAGECMVASALALAGAAEVYAIDAVPKQLWAAAAHHADRSRLRCVIGDASDLPFADASIDVVVAHLVLHHIEPLGPLMAEVARVLRPGGLFVAKEPAPLLHVFIHERVSQNEAPLPIRKIESELRAVGFSEVHSKYWWNRLNTGFLGPLSPSYVVRARTPGQGLRSNRVLRRPLEPTVIPGLQLDAGCKFASLAREQITEIARVFASLGPVPGFRWSGESEKLSRVDVD